jgi:protein O-GlcNAc transferase
LARASLADLFLDTLPHNAHTTASDVLWAGVPVLTCTGATFAGRVAGSLLRAAGLPDLIASSREGYEGLAVRLATDRPLLAAIRSRLKDNRASSPLFDTARYTRHLEAAYRGMWERYRRSAEPEAFAVDALPN